MPPGAPHTTSASSVFTLQVRRQREGVDAGTVTARCAGELDLATASLLTEFVQQQCTAQGRTLRLDLAGLRFCDASGLSALLAVRRHLESIGGRLELLNPPRTLRRTLTLTGLDEVLPTTGEAPSFPRPRTR